MVNIGYAIYRQIKQKSDKRKFCDIFSLNDLLLNMFTAGGSHAWLFCRQGTDLRNDIVCKWVPFFMS